MDQEGITPVEATQVQQSIVQEQTEGHKDLELQVAMRQAMERLVAERAQNGCVAFGDGDQRAVVLPHTIVEPYTLDPEIEAKLPQPRLPYMQGKRESIVVATVAGYKKIVAEGMSGSVDSYLSAYTKDEAGELPLARKYDGGIASRREWDETPVGYISENGSDHLTLISEWGRPPDIRRDAKDKKGVAIKLYLDDVTDPTDVTRALLGASEQKPVMTPQQASMEAARAIISAPVPSPAPAAK